MNLFTFILTISSLTFGLICAHKEMDEIVYNQPVAISINATGVLTDVYISELNEIMKNDDDINIMLEWALNRSCSLVLNNELLFGDQQYSVEIVRLNEFATKFCDQRIGQNDKFGTLFEYYSETIQKIVIYAPQIIEQLKKKEEEIQNSQNANEKEKLHKFGTDLNAFATELPKGRGKSALIKFLTEIKEPLLPSDLFNLLLKKVQTNEEFVPLIMPKMQRKKSRTNRLKEIKPRKKRMAQSPVVGAFVLLLALICWTFGSEMAPFLSAFAFIELNWY